MLKNVLEYLEQTVEQVPDRLAFADEAHTLTFSELYQAGRSIGTALARRTACHNRPIVVLVERSAMTVAAMLGVLYSGNFYVPLDRQMPRQRMKQLLEQLQPEALIFSQAAEELAAEFSPLCPLFLLEEAVHTAPDSALLALRRQRVLDLDPAYMIFTSGSTGLPKGIVISHHSIIDFMEWYTPTMGITGHDVLGNQAPFCFDLSVKDLYTTLKTGATTWIIPKMCFSFPLLLIRFLNQHHVTTLSWATSAFHLVANSGVLEKEVPERLRMVILGGEVLQAKQLNRWRRALPQVQYVNLYGPTEVTVDCTYYFIDREFDDTETIPIGKACGNMDVFLLDTDKNPVPQGTPGELCVRGSGLALGYYGDWERTAGAFLQNPKNPWYLDRIYRTGDLAVEDAAGNFCFIGRKDHQIKHGGYRIELGEIEAALNGLPKLDAAVCLYDRERDKIICIYQGACSGEEIARTLREMLPKYMLPNLYHQIRQMPYNRNGKIDRAQLKREYDGTNSD